MESHTASSIIFMTASGSKVEITSAQMESIRKSLWVNESITQPPNNENTQKEPDIAKKSNCDDDDKENYYCYGNDIDYFENDEFDDDFKMLDNNFFKQFNGNGKRVLEESGNSLDFVGEKQPRFSF